MTLTDVMCDMCTHRYLAGRTVRIHAGIAGRADICTDCADKVMAALGIETDLRTHALLPLRTGA